MIRVTTFSLACLMVLGNVIGEDVALPDTVNGRREQCQARGREYVGACISQNLADDNGMGCRYLVCAVPVAVPAAWTPKSKVNTVEYEARMTGPPLDGTECAAGSVCRKRKCVFVGLRNVPRQVGPGAEFRCQTPAYRALVRYPQPTTTTTTTTPAPAPTRKSVIISPKKNRNNRKQ